MKKRLFWSETADKHYPIDPVGAAAQELILLGGLEEWVKGKLGN